MTHLFTRQTATLALALLAPLAASQAQAQVGIDDWQHAAVACTPASADALRYGQFNLTAGYIRVANPSAGVLQYSCNVLDSFATAIPTWNRLVLQYRDATGGRVRATLYQKSKTTGATAPLITVISAPSLPVNEVAAPLPALDFAAFGYYVVLSIGASGDGTPPQVHMVQMKQ